MPLSVSTITWRRWKRGAGNPFTCWRMRSVAWPRCAKWHLPCHQCGISASSGMATTLALEEPSATVEALDPRALASVPGLVTDGGRADPEIIELFIEEAGEEIDAIRAGIPVWCEQPGDDAVLASLRRSFHTLKGSGRMVGAQLIGEFSWCFENLLNRIINKTMAPSPDLMALLGEAADALPQLLEQLEVGSAPSIDVAYLMERATALAEGREAAEPAPQPVEEPSGVDFFIEPEEAVRRGNRRVAGVTRAGGGRGRPVSTRSCSISWPRRSVRTSPAFAASLMIRGTGTPPFAVPEDLYRACHTLHGSVTMAKADAAAAAHGSAESTDSPCL